MDVQCSALDTLIHTIKALPTSASEAETVRSIAPLVAELVADTSWVSSTFYEVDESQGWSLHPLYVSPDNTVSMFVTAWKSGGMAPPHDHGTWVVIGGVDGIECNTLWQRTDDGSRPGYAEVEQAQCVQCAAGDVIIMYSDQIHSVENQGESVSLSLHVYGKHPDHVHRNHYDPERHTVETFVTNTIPDDE